MTSVRRQAQLGAAALLALIFGMLMISVLTVGASLSAVHFRAAARQRQEAAARTAAESGVAACLAAIRAGRAPGSFREQIGRARYEASFQGRASAFTIETVGIDEGGSGGPFEWSVRARGEMVNGRPTYATWEARGGARRSER